MSGPREPPSKSAAAPITDKGGGKNVHFSRNHSDLSASSPLKPTSGERDPLANAPRGPAKRKEAPSSRGNSPPHKQRPPARRNDEPLRNYPPEQRKRSVAEPERVDPRRDPRRNGSVGVRTPVQDTGPGIRGDGYFGNGQPKQAGIAPKVPSMVGTPTTETGPAKLNETQSNTTTVDGSSASPATQIKHNGRAAPPLSHSLARLHEHKDRAALRIREQSVKVGDVLSLREDYDKYKSATDEQIKNVLEKVNKQLAESNNLQPEVSREKQAWREELRKERDEWREQMRKERDEWCKQQEEILRKQKESRSAATAPTERKLKDLMSEFEAFKKEHTALKTKYEALTKGQDVIKRNCEALLKQQNGPHVAIEKFDAANGDIADLKAGLKSLQDAEGKIKTSIQALEKSTAHMAATQSKANADGQLKELSTKQERLGKRLDKLEKARSIAKPTKPEAGELKSAVEKIEELEKLITGLTTRLHATEQDVSTMIESDGKDILDSVTKLCAPFDTAIRELQNRPPLTDAQIALLRQQVANDVKASVQRDLERALADQSARIRTQFAAELGEDLDRRILEVVSNPLDKLRAEFTANSSSNPQDRVQKDVPGQSEEIRSQLSHDLGKDLQQRLDHSVNTMTEQLRTYISTNMQQLIESSLAPTKTALRHLQDRFDNISTHDLYQQIVHFIQSEHDVPNVINRLNEVQAYLQTLETGILPAVRKDVEEWKAAVNKRVAQLDTAVLEQAATGAALSGRVGEHGKLLTELEKVTSEMWDLCARIPHLESRLCKSEVIIKAVNYNSDQPLEGIEFAPGEPQATEERLGECRMGPLLV